MYTLATLTQTKQTLSGLPVVCDAAVWPTDARVRIAMTNGHTFPGSQAWSPPT